MEQEQTKNDNRFVRKNRKKLNLEKFMGAVSLNVDDMKRIHSEHSDKSTNLVLFIQFIVFQAIQVYAKQVNAVSLQGMQHERQDS